MTCAKRSEFNGCFRRWLLVSLCNKLVLLVLIQNGKPWACERDYDDGNCMSVDILSPLHSILARLDLKSSIWWSSQRNRSFQKAQRWQLVLVHWKNLWFWIFRFSARQEVQTLRFVLGCQCEMCFKTDSEDLNYYVINGRALLGYQSYPTKKTLTTSHKVWIFLILCAHNLKGVPRFLFNRNARICAIWRLNIHPFKFLH